MKSRYSLRVKLESKQIVSLTHDFHIIPKVI